MVLGQPRKHERAGALRTLRAPAPGILRPGRNCCLVATARRAGVTVDGAAYFLALRDAFERARRSILIVGWDFDGAVALDPVGCGPASRPLREYLPALLERRPELEVRILVWGFSVFYGQSQSPPPRFDRRWVGHPRLLFRFAYDCPFFGCHHQKIVCVDDALALCGGMDLTAMRWDVPTHDAGHPVRMDSRGQPYAPRHDVQLAVEGEAALALSEIARARWRDVTGQHLPPVDAGADVWPDSVPARLFDVPIGIARTCPARRSRAALREGQALIHDALEAAREHVYVESQYFTARAVGDHLAELLQRPRGPQIVIVVRRKADGLIQRFAMGSNRSRLLRRLAAVDRHHRLGVYYPVVEDPEGREHEIEVHSKVIAVDDRLLRIGSSNLNNRSMGYDSECDAALEPEDAQGRAAVRRITCELLAEHLGRSAEEVAAGLRNQGLLTVVERLNGSRGRRLVRFEADPSRGPRHPILGTGLVDRDAIWDPWRPLRRLAGRKV